MLNISAFPCPYKFKIEFYLCIHHILSIFYIKNNISKIKSTPIGFVMCKLEVTGNAFQIKTNSFIEVNALSHSQYK